MTDNFLEDPKNGTATVSPSFVTEKSETTTTVNDQKIIDPSLEKDFDEHYVHEFNEESFHVETCDNWAQTDPFVV